jgi:predicted ArsR family transcriptional regulator
VEKQTSQLILEYLSEHPGATVRQLSRALRLTPADIRYHLSKLIQQDLVSIVQTKISGERGRPARIYTLNQQIKPNNILSLTQAALTILFGKSEADKNSILENLADQMMPYSTRISASLTQKIIHLIGRLNQSGYSARWEARSKGPCLIFSNCPYRPLLAQFPELCEMDRLILQNHLSARIILDHHIHPNEPEPETCQFTVLQK